MSDTTSSIWTVLGLFVVSLFVFTIGLSSQEVVGFDSRFYLFAEEMWRHGFTWFPSAYHHPYPDYPVTSTALIYGVSKVLGGLSKLTAVLPTAVAASLTVVMTYVLGAKHNKQWGFCAALLLMMTVAFFTEARSVALDMYPTLFTLLAFNIVYSADRQNKSGHPWGVYLCLILSFAFRGPIGLVIPAGVVCTYYLLDRQIKSVFIVGILSLFVLLSCTFVLLSVAHFAGGDYFVHDTLRMEVAGRMDSGATPFYYYWVSGLASYALSFPLALLVMVGVLYRVIFVRAMSAELKLLLKLVGWVVIVLIGMSIPGDKKIRYILPISPAIALLAAYPMVATINEKYFALLRTFLLTLLLIFPLILLVGILYAAYYSSTHVVLFVVPYLNLVMLLCVIQSFGFLAYFIFNKRLAWRNNITASIAALCFVLVMLLAVEPAMLSLNKTRDFVLQVEASRAEQHARLVFYKEKADGLPIKYLINMPKEEAPLFVEDETALAHITGPLFVIMSADYYKLMSPKVATQFRVIASGKLGHVVVVVLAN